MKAIGMVTVKSAYNTFKGNGRKSMPLAELQEICLPKQPPKQGWTFYGNGKVIKECFKMARRRVAERTDQTKEFFRVVTETEVKP